MYGDMLVGSWVDIHDGCPIRYEIGGSDVVFVYCGRDPGKAFQFSLESEALRELVRQGGEALREMDEMFAREQAETLRALDMTGR